MNIGGMNQNSFNLGQRVIKYGTTGNESPTNQVAYVDTNENNAYDRGVDHVILSDRDGNGVLNDADAHNTARALQLMKNRRAPELNADTKFGQTEQKVGKCTTVPTNMGELDRDGNGRLGITESAFRVKLPSSEGSAKTLSGLTLGRDENNDGRFSHHELDFNARHVVLGVHQDKIGFGVRQRMTHQPLPPGTTKQGSGFSSLKNVARLAALANPVIAGPALNSLF